MIGIKTERRSGDALAAGQKFQWRDRWYIVGKMAGRRMAIVLTPNAPQGFSSSTGCPMPMGVEVEVLLEEAHHDA